MKQGLGLLQITHILSLLSPTATALKFQEQAEGIDYSHDGMKDPAQDWENQHQVINHTSLTTLFNVIDVLGVVVVDHHRMTLSTMRWTLLDSNPRLSIRTRTTTTATSNQIIPTIPIPVLICHVDIPPLLTFTPSNPLPHTRHHSL